MSGKVIEHAIAKWKPYPAYKDSGVEWLGEIPAHWEPKRLKFFVRMHGGGTPSKLEPDYWNGDIPWVSPKDMKSETVEDTEDKITQRGLLESSSTLIDPNAILVVVRSGILKHTFPIAINRVPVALNQDMKALVPTSGIRPEYLAWLLHGVSQNILVLCHSLGATVDSIETERLSNLVLAIAPDTEQCAIAAFLDRETTKIDALIARKERLITLLQEKRAALISHAVTKGLDPTVPMKESNIPTIGQIPAHWEAQLNKYLFYEIDDRSTSGEEELLTVSHITGITPRSEKDVNMFLAESMEGYKRCQPDDLVINTMWAWMGALGISKHEGIVSPSYNVYRLKRPNEFDPEYLDLLYRTPPYVSEINRYSKGVWSSRLRLYPDEFLQMITPQPPLHEQREIVAYVGREINQRELLIDKLRTSLDTLSEYRAALISAAVTGKIDVRGEVELDDNAVQ